jgi:hypothetical protein
MSWSKARPVATAKAKAEYGSQHKKLRAQLLPQAYGQPCSRCGRPMLPGQALHLDHTDNRLSYLGFSHTACNLKAAAKKARRIQVARKRGRVVANDRRLQIFDDSRHW